MAATSVCAAPETRGQAAAMVDQSSAAPRTKKSTKGRGRTMRIPLAIIERAEKVRIAASSERALRPTLAATIAAATEEGLFVMEARIALAAALTSP